MTNFASSVATHPVDLKIGPDGNLYYLSRGQSAVYKVSFTGSLAPSIVTQPSSQTVTVGESATFEVVASGASPLEYQWQRDEENIPGATSRTYTVASTTAADDGSRSASS